MPVILSTESVAASELRVAELRAEAERGAKLQHSLEEAKEREGELTAKVHDLTKASLNDEVRAIESEGLAERLQKEQAEASAKQEATIARLSQELEAKDERIERMQCTIDRLRKSNEMVRRRISDFTEAEVSAHKLDCRRETLSRKLDALQDAMASKGDSVRSLLELPVDGWRAAAEMDPSLTTADQWTHTVLTTCIAMGDETDEKGAFEADERALRRRSPSAARCAACPARTTTCRRSRRSSPSAATSRSARPSGPRCASRCTAAAARGGPA